MGKSSKDKRDVYYRLAKEQGWRARSAFKLLQLDEEFNLFEGVTRVVDLCAAPGSWSQVLSRVLIRGEKFGRRAWVDKMAEVGREIEEIKREYAEGEKDERPKYMTGEDEGNTKEQGEDGGMTPDQKRKQDVRIVSIDLQPMSPLDGITMLQADITAPSTVPLLLNALNTPYESSAASKSPPELQSAPPDPPGDPTPVQLVLSDGAPDVTGLHDLDIYVQSQLLRSALDLASRILSPGGKFVAKIFRAKDVDILLAQLNMLFETVTVAKPRSSRSTSLEAFVVCQGFFGGEIAQIATGGARRVDKPTQELSKTSASEIPEQKQGQRRVLRPDGITELHFTSDSEPESDIEFPPQPPPERWIPPFLACGDLSAWDADATYHLPEGYVSLDPVQPPTAPPYKRALEMRRAAGGAYGKTGSRAARH